jgi:Uma2 family endonuclease
MIASLRPLTYDDLVDLPNDGQRYEIIGGVLLVNPAPTWNHHRVAGELYRLINDFARQTGEGTVVFAPFDVVLGAHDIVEPDLVFVASEQAPVHGEGHSFQGAPHLLVEVISPSSRQSDNVKKLALYARAGVLEYWIADPVLRTLVINVLEGGMYLLIQPDADGWFSSRALRGLRVDPSDIFAGLD